MIDITFSLLQSPHSTRHVTRRISQQAADTDQNSVQRAASQPTEARQLVCSARRCASEDIHRFAATVPAVIVELVTVLRL